MSGPEQARPSDPYPTAELPEYERPSEDERDRLAGESGRRRGGCLPWLAGIVSVALAFVLGLNVAGLWPRLTNPFAEKTTDRSQPVLLKSIQDLSRFVAASGNFEVVVDVQTNRQFVPDIIFNQRTLFVAAGSVDAYVDFASLTEGALVVDEANKRVEVTLPAPQLEKPSIDSNRSYVFAEQRGIVNRIGDLFGGDPNRQQQLYQLAEAKIAEAARASELTRRAQENTEKMLRGMLTSLGYTSVNITFAQP
jgi:hypothetical protein